MKLWDSVTAWSISAGAALGLFWSYQGYSIAYVYENYAIQEHTFDHEVGILAAPVLEKKKMQVAHMLDAQHNRREVRGNPPG